MRILLAIWSTRNDGPERKMKPERFAVDGLTELKVRRRRTHGGRERDRGGLRETHRDRKVITSGFQPNAVAEIRPKRRKMLSGRLNFTGSSLDGVDTTRDRDDLDHFTVIVR